MNKKAQEYTGMIIIFTALWLMTSIIWTIWLNDGLVAIAGLITALIMTAGLSIYTDLYS